MAARILFIDDDVMVVKTIEKLLQKAGYEVGAAHSGAEALKKVRQEDFDLIVCDVRMPGMNGIETVERARDYWRENGKPHLPEILITGHASKENFEKARRLNVAAYIYKPFDLAEFLSAVSGALLIFSREVETPLGGRLVMDESAPAQRPVFWL